MSMKMSQLNAGFYLKSHTNIFEILSMPLGTRLVLPILPVLFAKKNILWAANIYAYIYVLHMYPLPYTLQYLCIKVSCRNILLWTLVLPNHTTTLPKNTATLQAC